MKVTIFRQFVGQRHVSVNYKLPIHRRVFSSATDQMQTADASEEPKKDKKRVETLLDEAAIGSGPLDDVGEDDNWVTSPYPKGAYINPKQSQALHSLRPKVNPSETSIILFPGQGTQYVGMCKNLLKFPAARDMFEAANQILEYDLLKLMLHGPKEKLDQTIHCQPAIVVSSLAALEQLKEERPWALENCMASAGFSVGEITALTFAGVFTFSDAIKLVRTRAEAMQLASELEPGGMATVHLRANSNLSKALENAKQWCADKGIEKPECRIATYLDPDMKVVAGHLEALKYLECNQTMYNLDAVKRIRRVGAFHSDIMRPAVSMMIKKIRNMNVMEPVITVHSNIDGKRYLNSNHIKRQLPWQFAKPIRWEQMMHILYERDKDSTFPETVVLGPKSPLPKYLKGVNAKAAENCFEL